MASLLPALGFLGVSLLGLGIAFFWYRHFSPDAAAKDKRLEEIQERRGINSDERLVTTSLLGKGAIAKYLRSKFPGIQALDLILIRAGSRQDAEQVLLMCTVLGIVGFALGTALVGELLVGLVVAGILGSLPVLILSQRAQSRTEKFEMQLPEGLDFLARALRAGHSLTAAIGMVGDELSAPIGPEFKTTFDQISFGVPFGDALNNLALRVGGKDLNFFVVAIVIQRETGGNLTELLGSLARTIRDRMKLKGKVRVLSAEGRFSGVMLGSVPFVLGGILSVLNPEYMSELWTTDTGLKAVGIGITMLILGFAWMWKLIQIKV